ncbi:uncharacterized protein [Cicer arietinum]|uniref:uncharacterized protein n=1 Tax=Cicer arietinum TaxID=3827 RepID=UPI003CC61211
MAPFEALYGRRCRTPLCWFETGDSLVLGPEIVQQTTDKVKMIQEKMRASQSRQKSYHDKRRKNLEFQEGDHVFLRVTPTTGVGRALKMRKLTPRFIGPYQILKCVGNVAYQIALPPSLSNLHSVFHVSQLRKYIFDPSHVIESDKVQIKENLTFETLPLRIEDRKIKELRGKTIPLVKVVWGGASGESATWEVESQMRDFYPELLSPGVVIVNLLNMLLIYICGVDESIWETVIKNYVVVNYIFQAVKLKYWDYDFKWKIPLKQFLLHSLRADLSNGWDFLCYAKPYVHN